MGVGNASRNYRKGDYERAADDWFVEPRWCVEALADAIDIVPGSYVWDPCCGMGTIPAVFAERLGQRQVFATDIVDRGYSHFLTEHDLSRDGCPLGITPMMRLNIVMNPPFRIAADLIKKALGLADYHVAVLHQLSFLAGQKRHELFSKYPPAQVLILSRRPSMPPGSLIAELGDRAFKGGTIDFAWTIWTKGHSGPTVTRWLLPEVQTA